MLHRVRDTDSAFETRYRETMGKRYFVYIVTNRRRGVLYVGVTSNLVQRVTAHKGKLIPGFTRTYGLTMLVYAEEYASILEARARARVEAVATGMEVSVIELINPDWRDLSDELHL